MLRQSGFWSVFRSFSGKKTKPSVRPRKLVYERLDHRLALASIVWVGDPDSATASWSEGSNWSGGAAPGPNDIAVFTSNETVHSTNSVIDQDFNIAGLVVDELWGGAGGAIHADSNLTLSGDFQLASGHFFAQGAVTLNGANSVWSNGAIHLNGAGIVNNGTWTFDTTNLNLAIDQPGILTNHGVIQLKGSKTLIVGSNASVQNAVDGRFLFLNDGTVGELFGAKFENWGLIRKAGGTGTSNLAITFDNRGGTLQADAGTLQLNTKGGTLINGVLNAAAGATLNLTGGKNVTYQGLFRGTGAGTVGLTSGSVVIPNAGATFKFSGSLLQWSGGFVDVTSGGTLSIPSGGVLNIKGANMQQTGSGKVLNNGQIVVAAQSHLILSGGTTLQNSSLGRLSFSGDGLVMKSGTGTFNNYGVIEKIAGTGTSIISATFNHFGTKMNVLTGTLALETAGGLINGANINVSTGATLNLANLGTVNYTGLLRGSGNGTVLLSGNKIHVGPNGLTMNFPGSMFRWTGGTIDVAQGSVTNLNSVYVATSGYATLEGAGKFINKKTILHNGAGNLQIRDGALFENAAGATYELQTDGDFFSSNGGLFKNVGTLRKTNGDSSTVSFFSATLDNTGTVEVTKGTLVVNGIVNQFDGTSLNAGRWNAVSSATVPAVLKFNSAPLGIRTIGGSTIVTLRGPLASIPQLNVLATINGMLILQGKQQFKSNGSVLNNGRLNLDPTSSFTVGGNGSYTQTSTATLNLAIGGTNTVPISGQIAANQVTVAGNLNVISTVTPNLQSVITLIRNTGGSPISGTFNNLPEGSVLMVNSVKYRLSYQGNGGHDVTLTAIA